jgi:thiosulfate dehydrogenase [quinone] large subunit
MAKRLKHPAIATICILRIIVGGHLFFAGMIKLINPGWSSLPFLENARIPFFRLIANNEGFIQVIDTINVWGLILIGAFLVIGVWDRVAAIGGTILLSFYYFAYPPFQLLSDYKPGIEPAFIVNATLIEILVLVLLIAVPTGRVFGLTGLMSERKVKKEEPQVLSTRRQMLKSLGTLPILGIFGIPFLQRGYSEKVNAVTGASSMVLRDDYRTWTMTARHGFSGGRCLTG